MTKEHSLTADALRSMLDYNPSTGEFTRRCSGGGVTIGGVVGNVNSNGYLVIGMMGTKYRLHRLAWLHVHGVWPTGTIDHIDGNRANNAICNLRDVSQAVNKQNIRVATVASSSGILGVYFSQRRKGYMASITMGDKQKRRGPYRTTMRAYAAYLELKRMHHEGCTL